MIDAINRNQPFDQFTIEQIAGDMLPEATEQQLIATGFHRNTLINEEGGTDQEQFRVEAVVDRVNTTGAVWLGLTVGCARCHTHKYDPITQVEYYQLFALLNNCDEPTIEVADAAAARARASWLAASRFAAEIKQLEEELEKQRPGLEAEQREWEATVTPQQRARLPGPVQVAFDMKFDKRDDEEQEDDRGVFSPVGCRPAGVSAARSRFLSCVSDEPKIPTTMILRERSGAARDVRPQAR